MKKSIWDIFKDKIKNKNPLKNTKILPNITKWIHSLLPFLGSF